MLSDESQESTSTSSEYSLNISFENINYNVRHGILAGGRKTILRDVNGTFNSGELNVIIGQSGAGKSSLMDILAGYTKATSGDIYVNGRLRDENTFRRQSCYILQDDQLQDMLTIQENLTIAAELRLGNHVSKEQKEKRINEIVTSLSLVEARHTRAGDLSGGQKKRLAIGQELVTDPPVMFLDEPTSGVDSSVTKKIIELLHQLARQGRTVVITMHQPSATLLPLIDRLYALVGGNCAYIGSVDSLLPFLKRIDRPCQPYHNPVEHLIELCGEYEIQQVLVEFSQNGRNNEWILSNETDSSLNDKNIKICNEVYLTTLPPPKEDPTKKILLSLKSTYSTSFWRQFSTLTRRSILSIWRNPSFTLILTGIHCLMALFIGFLFFNIGHDARYVRENYNMLYFSLMFLMFTAFSAVTINFPQEIPVVRREFFNRWYSTAAYYSSTLVSALPTQGICTLTYACIVYWMTGQPPEPKRFFGFCWTLLMVSSVALCLGLLNGATFNVKNGVIFGPFFILPFTIFSGFFLRYSDAPVFVQWIFHISFLKHGLVGLVFSIFGMEREKLPCSALYCHYRLPAQFIKDVEMSTEQYFIVVIALFAIGTGVILISYFILNFRLKHKW
ncbi:ATP-binding cassette sub-family G member 4-like [Plodia interpunctella]|uniref:ATP-binding cassette sub-family G member 4-like n=1 Tax=Plodia interpunctella TaxID=58824 RepID=UPI00236772E6|nr:ATP-binding cassette sub-family G member 4-like [Plodia interpunctella]